MQGRAGRERACVGRLSTRACADPHSTLPPSPPSPLLAPDHAAAPDQPAQRLAVLRRALIAARARQELACALSALGFPYHLDLLLATARAAVARADPFTGAAAAPYDVRDLEAAARRVAHLEGLGLLDVAAGPGRASESA